MVPKLRVFLRHQTTDFIMSVPKLFYPFNPGFGLLTSNLVFIAILSHFQMFWFSLVVIKKTGGQKKDSKSKKTWLQKKLGDANLSEGSCRQLVSSISSGPNCHSASVSPSVFCVVLDRRGLVWGSNGSIDRQRQCFPLKTGEQKKERLFHFW